MPEILNTIQSSILLNLKSDEAETINGSDVTFGLSTPIEALPGNRILLNWVSVEIPNSQYLVNEKNNTLSLTIDGVNTTLVFPNGNYTITSFEEKLEELWTASHVTTALTVDFNELSLKYVLTFQKSGLIIVTVDYKKSTILKIMGFDTTADTSLISSDSSTVVLTSKNIVNFQRTKSFYLKTDSFALKNLNSNGKKDGCIAKLQLRQTDHGDILYAMNQDVGIRYLLDSSRINTLRLFLVDDDNNKVDLNGHSYSLSLAFYFIQERKYARRESLSEFTH
jgi:hypothetical protein